jgi:hypothetical protein
MNYPKLTCITNATKNEFVEISLSLLQQEHNIMGEWFHPDKPLILESRYHQLRAEVQIRWPYDGNKLSESEWGKYKDERFDPKWSVLVAEKGRLKELLANSTRFSPNLDDDIF